MTTPKDDQIEKLIALSKQLVGAVQGAMVKPWGYCLCPAHMRPMEHKPDDAHCGECRDLRVALADADMMEKIGMFDVDAKECPVCGETRDDCALCIDNGCGNCECGCEYVYRRIRSSAGRV